MNRLAGLVISGLLAVYSAAEPQKPDVAKKHLEAISAALLSGDLDRAREYLTEVDKSEPADVRTAVAWGLEHEVRTMDGTPEALFEVQRWAIRMWERILGPEDFQTGLAWRNLSIVQLRKDYRADAEQSLRRAVEIVERSKGPLHPALGGMTRDLARMAKDAGRFPEAETQYLRAIDTLEKTAGKTSSALADYLIAYSDLLKAMARDTDAEAVLKRAHSLRLERPAPESGVTPPTVVLKKDPEMTVAGRAAKANATVVIKVQVTATGVTDTPWIDRWVGLGLDEAALQSIAQWRFRPATRQGVAVPVQAMVEINFRVL